MTASLHRDTCTKMHHLPSVAAPTVETQQLRGTSAMPSSHLTAAAQRRASRACNCVPTCRNASRISSIAASIPRRTTTLTKEKLTPKWIHFWGQPDVNEESYLEGVDASQRGKTTPRFRFNLLNLEDTVSELHAVDTERASGRASTTGSRVSWRQVAARRQQGADLIVLAALGLQVSDVDNGVHLL
jgi:hypothetical protein